MAKTGEARTFQLHASGIAVNWICVYVICAMLLDFRNTVQSMQRNSEIKRGNCVFCAKNACNSIKMYL